MKSRTHAVQIFDLLKRLQHANHSCLWWIVPPGHDMDASGAPGAFAYIKDLRIGDKIKIHFGGQIMVYEVVENQQVLPTEISTIFKHEDSNNTCKSYDHRQFARAALISVIPDKQK